VKWDYHLFLRYASITYSTKYRAYIFFNIYGTWYATLFYNTVFEPRKNSIHGLLKKGKGRAI